MATALSGSAKEKTNYARLCRLLVDVASQVARDVLATFYPPGGLHTFLKSPVVHNELKSLLKKRTLNPTQWSKLFPVVPASVSSSGFDITLLFVLLTNKDICGLSPPSKGWSALPAVGDINREDDLARIKYYRNTIYAHASHTPISDTDFQIYWKDISDALLRVGGTSYKQPISDLKHVCMDPVFEDHYIEILKLWQMDEYSMKEMLKDIGNQLKQESGVKDKVEQISDQLKQDSGVKKKVEEISDQLKQESGVKGKVEQISDQLKRDLGVKKKVEEISDQLKQESGVKDKVKHISDQLKQEAGVKEKMEKISERVEEISGHLKNKGQLKESEEFNVMTCSRTLKKMYSGSMSQVNLIPWNSEDTIHIDEVYTRLQWVQQEKTVIGSEEVALNDYTDVFTKPSKHHEKPKRILVLGIAGIGKSTFSSKVAVDWALGRKEELQKFQIVVVLRLREMYSVATLSEALQKCLGFEQSDAERTIEYMKKNSDKVLLILDGLDEYNIEKNSEVMKILEGHMLPECIVMVTSRPWMGEKIRKHVHARYQIMGFEWDDIEKYIARHFESKDEIDSFLNYVFENDLFSLSKIPLLLLFLCLLWKERQYEDLPSNRTELYKQIVQCIINHNNAKSNTASENTLDNNAEVLKQIGKIAFEALQKNSLIFPYGELAITASSNEILSLGLLSVTKAPTANPKEMISFLHKSIQEFLAAWYITFLVENQRKDEVREIMDDLQLDNNGKGSHLWHSESVVHFICGLSDSGCVHVLNKIGHIARTKLSEVLAWEFADIPETEILYFHEHCFVLYCDANSRSEDVRRVLSNCVGNAIALRVEMVCCLRVLVPFLIEGKFRGLFFDSPMPIHCAEKVARFFDEVEIKRRNLESSAVSTFLNYLISREIVVRRLWIQADAGSALSVLQYDYHPQWFDQQACLDVIKSYPDGLVQFNCDFDFDRNTFAEIPLYRLRRLKKLEVNNGMLGDRSREIFVQQLRHMPYLRDLSLPEIGMESSSGRVFGENLHHNKMLQMLDLSCNSLGDDSLIILSHSLHEIPHLKKLNLRKTNMTMGGVRAVSGALQCIPQLEWLNLSKNPLGVGGVSSVVKNLHYTPHLKYLDLSETRTTLSGAAPDALALPNLPELWFLDLSGNSLCDAEGQTLAYSLCNIPKLKYLLLSGNRLGDSCVGSVINNLCYTPNIERLDLCETYATFSGAAASLALPSLPRLVHLDLSNNFLCDAAVQTLSSSLYNAPQLERLYLRSTRMTGEGLKALAGCLCYTKLLYLSLSYNTCITDSEAWRKLAAELRPRKYGVILDLDGVNIIEPVMEELNTAKYGTWFG